MTLANAIWNREGSAAPRQHGVRLRAANDSPGVSPISVPQRPVAESQDQLAAGVIVDMARTFVMVRQNRTLVAVDLAGAAGAGGEREVRHALMVQTGLRVGAFVLAIRLDVARAWLLPKRDSRIAATLAAVLRLVRTAALRRTDQRRFGETIVVTRWRMAPQSTCGRRAIASDESLRA